MMHSKAPTVDPPSRPDEAPRLRAAGRPAPAPRRFESGVLFAGTAEVLIQHRGHEYRLRITQDGKLVLHA